MNFIYDIVNWLTAPNSHLSGLLHLGALAVAVAVVSKGFDKIGIGDEQSRLTKECEAHLKNLEGAATRLFSGIDSIQTTEVEQIDKINEWVKSFSGEARKEVHQHIYLVAATSTHVKSQKFTLSGFGDGDADKNKARKTLKRLKNLSMISNAFNRLFWLNIVCFSIFCVLETFGVKPNNAFVSAGFLIHFIELATVFKRSHDSHNLPDDQVFSKRACNSIAAFESWCVTRINEGAKKLQDNASPA